MAVPTPTRPASSDSAERSYEVTPLELFFDLVFVFAVSQLSQHLSGHLSWRGAAETLVLLRAVFTVWFTTSWSATIIPADRVRTRWLVLTVMLLGLFMNASVTRAFTTSGWAFVVPFLAVQLGRALWTRVHAPDPVFRDHYFRTLLWLIAISPLWLLGAAAPPGSRLVWWALAAGIDLVGASLAHPIPGRRLQSENLEFDADHMLERCRLFLLIALGETVFTTGVALAHAPFSGAVLAAGTLALWTAVALWALSFGRSQELIQRHLEETTNPVRASRYAVNALMVKVAGLIALAVANEQVIARPGSPTSAAVCLLLFGGPVLFLAAQGWYLWAVPNAPPRAQVVGSAALVLMGCAALLVPATVALALAALGLTVLVLVDRQYPAVQVVPSVAVASRPRTYRRVR